MKRQKEGDLTFPELYVRQYAGHFVLSSFTEFSAFILGGRNYNLHFTGEVHSLQEVKEFIQKQLVISGARI